MAVEALQGKVAIVTGSSRGIGLATARELARRGARVVLNGRGEERLERAREALEREGHDVAALRADVACAEACRELIERAVERFGKLDVLVNNAGVSMRARLEDLAPEICRHLVDVNLMGSIYPALFAIPRLKETRGSLIFVSSIAGLIGLPTASIYCATKAALRGLAHSLRCELARDGVHVGVVYVGFTENDPGKKVIGPGDSRLPPDRPAHITQAEVAREIAGLIRRRRRQAILSPMGKLAGFAGRMAPGLVERSIIFATRHNLGERVGVR